VTQTAGPAAGGSSQAPSAPTPTLDPSASHGGIEKTLPRDPARTTLTKGRGRRRAVVLGACAALAVAAAPFALRRALFRSASVIDAERLASFSPLHTTPEAADEAGRVRILLGRKLFRDPRLSKNGNVSCNTCHPLDAWGTDGKRVSRSSDGVEHVRNTLGIYNLAGYSAFLWDGRQTDLALLSHEIMMSPRAMASNPDAVIRVLTGIPAYPPLFERAFPGSAPVVSVERAAQALAAFQETLVVRGRWDRFLEGDAKAITDREKAGFNRFVEVGCVQCHYGPHVGATMFQKVGLVKAWPDAKDRGRYEITKRDIDYMVFRVPSLRNVAETSPYFHDGSVTSLPTAIRMMAHHQIGRDLEDEDVALIEAWLLALTGELPVEPPDPPG
jgi:cytochrome c peroxidase